MSLKKILNKILHTEPFRSLDAEINDRINNKLTKFIQPLNLAVAENGRAIAEARQAVAGIQRSMEETAREHLAAINELRGLLTNWKAEGVYQVLHLCIFDEFNKAFRNIVGEEYRDLLPQANLFLLEITKNYLTSDGAWRLEREISSFNRPPALGRGDTVGEIGTFKESSRDKRLKILIVSGMFPSVEHGGGLRLFDIVSILSDGHDVDLFSLVNPELDQPSQELIKGKLGQVKLVCADNFDHENIKSWLLSLNRSPCYYDVVQCEYPQSARLIETLRPFGKKIGFTFMECVTRSALIRLRNSLEGGELSSLGLFARSFWEIAVTEHAAARSTDFQIAVTKDDAGYIERVSGVKPYIIPTALSPSQVIAPLEARGQVPPEGNTVVFLGYFDHFPNVDGVKWYLNKIHPIVKRGVADYRFLVVGRGDLSPLRELSDADSSVVYTGRVDDITSYILRGKVCVLPLISGAGIRGKLNQYSIAGRPSVSTSIGNMGLDYKDGEAVLIADEPRDFAAAVVRLLTDDGLNATLAANARAYAHEHFTWDRHIDKLLEIYRS